MARNLLLGNGDKLTSHSPLPTGGGPKRYPYDIDEARAALAPGLQEIQSKLDEAPQEVKPRGEGVFQVVLHPAFLGRSYFPNDLFRESGLRDIGSKEVVVAPRKAVKTEDQGKPRVTASIFVAGDKQAVKRLESYLIGQSTGVVLRRQLTEIEKVGWLDSDGRLKGAIPQDNERHKFEAVLHAGQSEDDIVQAFVAYAKSLQAVAQQERRIQTGGLTFLPILATGQAIRKLAEFSFLRVARLMPELRIALPDTLRKETNIKVPSLPEAAPLLLDEKVAIFDGGLGSEDLKKWVTEIILPGTERTVAGLLQHGNEVTSTFLFGRINAKKIACGPAYLGVDHYRVLPSGNDTDHDLFDVLERIRRVLDTGQYRFANLSLGPRLPIGDDDIHAWTATLDQVCAQRGVLAAVAVGNDGREDGEAGRIQPPSDMVNAIAVGAADRSGKKWKRAGYSCIGPGRSPGFVKPDGLAFGGSERELFYTYNVLSGQVVGVAGTSYSSPLALRTMAGVTAYTSHPLTVLALKALLVHNAEKCRQPQAEIGWGRFVEDPTVLLECVDDSATVVYQGQLAKNEYLRASIPFPQASLTGPVEIKATLCIQAPTDPEHALNYTRAGLQVHFRPRFGLKDEATAGFFGHSNQYQTERESRDDGHKWETCLHRARRFDADTVLNDPVFDIRYHARQTSRRVPPLSAPDMSYAMIVTIKVAGMTELYNLIRQRYQVLQPVQLRVGIDLPGA